MQRIVKTLLVLAMLAMFVLAAGAPGVNGHRQCKPGCNQDAGTFQTLSSLLGR